MLNDSSLNVASNSQESVFTTASIFPVYWSAPMGESFAATFSVALPSVTLRARVGPRHTQVAVPSVVVAPMVVAQVGSVLPVVPGTSTCWMFLFPSLYCWWIRTGFDIGQGMASGAPTWLKVKERSVAFVRLLVELTASRS